MLQDMAKELGMDQSIIENQSIPWKDVVEVWMVRVLESTASYHGVSWCTAALAAFPSKPGLYMFGELYDNEVAEGSWDNWWSTWPPQRFEILQAPAPARCLMTSPGMLDKFQSACIQTKDATRSPPTSDWSMRTAVVSFFLSPCKSRLRRSPQPEALKKHWAVPPICTSVCIEAWQRFLLASAATDEQGCKWILDVVPFRAGRTLPRDFLRVLDERGWRRLTDLPLFFIPFDASPLARPALDAEEVTLGGVEGVEATAPERARCGVEA